MIRILIAMSIIGSYWSSAETLVGVAKNSKGETVYIEKHEITFDSDGLNKLIRVSYSKPDGSMFATMISDFSNNKTLPDTTFEDMRFKSKETIRTESNSVHFEEIKNEKSVLKKSHALDSNMVASQGFDNFIKANSKKLLEKPLDFRFGVLDNKDFYSLTGYKRLESGPDEVAFGIRSSHWLVRLFVKEIKVVYDSKKLRLKSFTGRSNILDDSGRAQDVVINYSWDDK